MLSQAKSALRWLGVLVLVAGLSALVHAQSKTTSKSTSKTAPKKRATKPAGSKKVTAGKTRKKTSGRRSRRARRGAWKRRGQQAMDQQRIRKIQEALIQEKYLRGEPTGAWDDRSRQAMMKYQQDNGWQAKVVPDSRALIKLGLGPTYAGVLNPESISAPGGSGPATLPSAETADKIQP